MKIPNSKTYALKSLYPHRHLLKQFLTEFRKKSWISLILPQFVPNLAQNVWLSSIRGKKFLLYLGWTMVFKVVSNVSANGKSSSQMWSSSETINENRSEVLNIDSSFGGHYQNRFVPNWHLVKPKEVSLSFKIAHDKFSLSYR